MSRYGVCPRQGCGADVTNRERRPNGNDTCAKGHVYPSNQTLASPPKPRKPDPVRADRKVFKFPVPRFSEYLEFDPGKLFTLRIRSEDHPRFRMFGRDATQQLCIWFEVQHSPQNEVSKLFAMSLCIVATGQTIPDETPYFEKTIIDEDGLVWHLYRGEACEE